MVEVAVRAKKENLFKQVVDLLRGRPGWHLQAMSTPGAAPVWCFGSGGEIELSVTVVDGSICVYVMDTDQDVVLANTDDLMAWLNENKEGSLQDPTGGVMGKLRSRKLFEWE